MYIVDELRLLEAELMCSILNKEDSKPYLQQIYGLIESSEEIEEYDLVETVFQSVRKSELPLSISEIDDIFTACEDVVGSENLEKENLTKYLNYYMNICENKDMAYDEKIKYLGSIMFEAEENNELQIRVLSDMLFYILKEEKCNFDLMIETKDKLKKLLDK